MSRMPEITQKRLWQLIRFSAYRIKKGLTRKVHLWIKNIYIK